MELGEIWKELDKKKLSMPVLGAVDIVSSSRHPVEKMRQAYRISVGFTLIFLIAFILLFVFTREPLVRWSVSVVILGYIIFLVSNISMYRKTSRPFPVDKSLIVVLEHTHDFISKNIRFQERVGLYIYPFAMTCGFLYGGSAAGNDLETFIHKRIVIISFVVLLIVLTPLCFYLTRWMYRVSYGKCLTELKGLIDEMKKSE